MLAALGPLLRGLAAYLVLRPLLGLGHELVVAGLALVLRAVVATGVWEPLIAWLGLDPIYTGAAVRAIGGVQVAGFAVADPLGSALHNLLPGVVLPSDRLASGAVVSMVAAAGAPALGRAAAAFGADVVWLAIGIGMFWHWRRTRWPVALIGLLIQALIAVNHLFDAQVDPTMVNASGVPFAVAVALPGSGWFTDQLVGAGSMPWRLLTGLLLVLLGYLCASPLAAIALWLGHRAYRGGRPAAVQPPVAQPGRRAQVVFGGLVALVLASSPVGALARGESNWQATAVDVRPGRERPRAVGRQHTLRLAGPTVVSVTPGPDGGWQYLVDGVPETIRGVGYNPQYAALGPADRASHYQRDFSQMRQLGINTIEGWFETQFDDVTLDNAARNGIGVLMPFELNQDWDYTDATVQAHILDAVSAYVLRYKSHPAVRMWAPGNENLHRVLYPHWVSQANVPAARARAEAFAAFLPRLVDQIHALDPDHPVVYRDAEDVYLGWITAAFGATGVQRPWLVYGANVYATPRLQDIIAHWPAQWPGRPLLISEFAPAGVGPAERPLGFEQQWALITSRPDVVLGGLAYTWATNGPEDLDRVFGLVDANGVPTDAALAALSGAYLTN